MKTFLCALFSAGFAWIASGEDGTIRATTTLHPDGSRSVTIVDPDKSTADETVSDATGKMVRKVTYLLDDRGQPLGGITYNATGAIMYRASYKRDGENRIGEETITGPEGQFIRRRVYTYGTGNKVTNVEEYDEQGNLVSTPHRAAASTGRSDKKPARR